VLSLGRLVGRGESVSVEDGNELLEVTEEGGEVWVSDGGELKMCSGKANQFSKTIASGTSSPPLFTIGEG